MLRQQKTQYGELAHSNRGSFSVTIVRALEVVVVRLSSNVPRTKVVPVRGRDVPYLEADLHAVGMYIVVG